MEDSAAKKQRHRCERWTQTVEATYPTYPPEPEGPEGPAEAGIARGGSALLPPRATPASSGTSGPSGSGGEGGYVDSTACVHLLHRWRRFPAA